MPALIQRQPLRELIDVRLLVIFGRLKNEMYYLRDWTKTTIEAFTIP